MARQQHACAKARALREKWMQRQNPVPVVKAKPVKEDESPKKKEEVVKDEKEVSSLPRWEASTQDVLNRSIQLMTLVATDELSPEALKNDKQYLKSPDAKKKQFLANKLQKLVDKEFEALDAELTRTMEAEITGYEQLIHNLPAYLRNMTLGDLRRTTPQNVDKVHTNICSHLRDTFSQALRMAQSPNTIDKMTVRERVSIPAKVTRRVSNDGRGVTTSVDFGIPMTREDVPQTFNVVRLLAQLKPRLDESLPLTESLEDLLLSDAEEKKEDKEEAAGGAFTDEEGEGDPYSQAGPSKEPDNTLSMSEACESCGVDLRISVKIDPGDGCPIHGHQGHHHHHGRGCRHH